MEAIITGIYAKYSAANAFKTACTGGLHYELAPQGTSLPFATFQYITGHPEYVFGLDVIEYAVIQFDIYAATNAIRQDLKTKLKALYDNVKLTVTGYTAMDMHREMDQDLREGEQDELFRSIVQYRVSADKN